MAVDVAFPLTLPSLDVAVTLRVVTTVVVGVPPFRCQCRCLVVRLSWSAFTQPFPCHACVRGRATVWRSSTPVTSRSRPVPLPFPLPFPFPFPLP